MTTTSLPVIGQRSGNIVFKSGIPLLLQRPSLSSTTYSTQVQVDVLVIVVVVVVVLVVVLVILVVVLVILVC